jgi:hypothetical protein
MNITRSAFLVIAGLALAACGSDDPDPAPPPPPVQSTNEVPASAYASAVAYSNYAASLPTTDTAEPLLLGSTPAPTSETEEPIAAK